jgi:hypothetical protein
MSRHATYRPRHDGILTFLHPLAPRRRPYPQCGLSISLVLNFTTRFPFLHSTLAWVPAPIFLPSFLPGI